MAFAQGEVNRTMAQDLSFTNEVTVSNGGALEYHSLNTDIATVELTTGRVTILKAGDVVIEATEADSANYLGQTVGYPLKVSLVVGDAISFSSNKIDRKMGAPVFTEKVAGGNGGEIVYTSSPLNVASVNETSGEVTIVGVGTAVITATEQAGDVFAEQSTFYTVEVARGAGETLAFAQGEVNRTMAQDLSFTN
ncbi:Calcium-binding outer membrane-like protein, partial [Moritella viscosa]